MQRILSVSQMREADDYTINKLKIPFEVLVERAGIAVYEEIVKRFRGGRVLVFIGKGNNGADGKVIANLLSDTHGFSVSKFFVGVDDLSKINSEYDIFVDCIFGTGLNKEVKGEYYKAIEYINKSSAVVISCDIPSGLNGDNGIPMGIAVKANLTVAIQDLKTGHFLNDGLDYCGEIVVKDIGISVWEEKFINRLQDVDVKTFFPNRSRNVNKGCFGKSTIFGGSKNYSGSVILSLNALLALKMGAGYSNLAIPNSLFNVYSAKFPECTITCVNDVDGNIVFDKQALDKLTSYDSISFGMGVGVGEEIYKTVCYLLNNYDGNLILDADALNSLAFYGIDVLKNKKCRVVLTPHVGEFSRLTSIPKKDIVTNPINLAKNFANEYDVVLLLKSSTSIITDGNRVVINTTGCSGMAKGGSGDLLSGICAGLSAREHNLFDAICVSSYLFGKCGEHALSLQNEYCVTPSDFVASIPSVINKLRD